MAALGEFFVRLARDIEILSHPEDQNISPDIAQAEQVLGLQDERLASVFARVLGLGALVVASTIALEGVPLLLAEPVTAISTLVAAAVAAVFGHDCIVVGSNMSVVFEAIQNRQNSNADIIDRTIISIGHFFQIGGIALNQDWRGTPYALHGTWVFEDIYKTFLR